LPIGNPFIFLLFMRFPGILGRSAFVEALLRFYEAEEYEWTPHT